MPGKNRYYILTGKGETDFLRIFFLTSQRLWESLRRTFDEKGIAMSGVTRKQHQLEMVLKTMPLPGDISLRCWQAADFPAVQRLSTAQGWPTPSDRPEESLRSWEHSWPTLVACDREKVVGFVRGLTDGEITTYIAELLVDPDYRGRGLGRLLLDVCHSLHSHTRLELIAGEEFMTFYKKSGFRTIGTGLRKSYR